jgi:hypothetical protein
MNYLGGYQEIAKLNKTYGVYDPEFEFSTLEPIPNELRHKWKQFVERG